MIHLRPYQQKAVEDIQNAFKEGLKRIILQLGTGGGKTIIFTHIAKLVSGRNKRVLILTNRVELLLQASGALNKIGLKAFHIQAGCKEIDSSYNVYIGMEQTLRRRLHWKEFFENIDLVIIDEMHLQGFNIFFEQGLFDNKFVLGVSATPQRGGSMRQLALDYEKIITTISVRELIAQGYLVNEDYYGADAPDMSKVSYNPITGDYSESSMFQQFNKTKLYKGVIDNYKKHVDGTKALVFCVNIEHAIKTTIEFKQAGYDAKFIVSNISKPKLKEGANEGEKARYNEKLRVYEIYKNNFETLSGSRDNVIKGFLNNDYRILINVAVLTCGFDAPDVETVILNRATVSMTLLRQMLGRGSRISEGKTHFNTLDFGGNAPRLGYYIDDVQWSLWHSKKQGEGLPPVKYCGEIKNQELGCGRMILASYKICPFCGFKYPEKKLEAVELGVKLPEHLVKAKKNVGFRNMTFDQLDEYRKFKGYKSPWLWRQLWYRGREGEITRYANHFNWNRKTLNTAIKFCTTHIK